MISEKEATMYCFAGKLLFADLSSGTIETRPLPEDYARQYLGGPGLGARILYDEMPAHVGVFDPESVVGWVCGALNDSSGFMTCRYTVVSKSPVYNGWNDANSGGSFGPALRRAGFDGIFFRGISPKPVYLYIDNGKAELRDASRYWGTTTTSELEDALQEELGKKVVVSSIGRAGEQKKYTAAVMNDRHRAAGRGGTGAVIGSKFLKAVVVSAAGGKTEIADRELLKELNKKMLDWQKNGPVQPVREMFINWGTGASYESSVLSGDAGTKNWAGSYLDLDEDKIGNLTSEAMDALYRVKKFACFGCPVGCGAIYQLKDEGYDIEDTGRSEYETSGGFGSLVGCSDPLTVNLCNTWCNEYGLDTISVSGTVAWAMECYEAGVFSKEDLEGIELTWGNHMAVRELTEKICKCEGIGAVLADGSKRASEVLGRGEDHLVTANGIELPQHDSRLAPPLARTFKYDPTPGRHVKGGLGALSGNNPPEYKNNPDAFADDDVNGVATGELRNNGGFCLFTDWGMYPGGLEEFLNAGTGFNMTAEEFRTLGLRSFMMRHAFNLREGFRRKDAHLSDRMLGIPPLKEGPLAGISVDVEKMADNFYDRMGCDRDGVPSREALEKLGGLEPVIKDLYGEEKL